MASVTLTINDNLVSYVQKYYPSANLKDYAEGLIESRIIQDIDLKYQQNIGGPMTAEQRRTALMAL